MNFYIDKLLLWLKNGKLRTLSFSNDKVNVITGNSKTGKTAILEIIDYCLCGSKETVVISYEHIAENVAWYGIRFFINDKVYTIARGEITEKGRFSKDYYFSQTGEIPEWPCVKMEEPQIKAILEQEFSIDNEITVSYGGKSVRKNTKLSFRYFLMFNTLSKDIIDNGKSFFDKMHIERYRDVWPQIFDLALGVINFEALQMQKKIDEIQQEIYVLEIDKRKSVKRQEVYKESISSLVKQAKEAGLINEDLALSDAFEVLKNLLKDNNQGFANDFSVEQEYERLQQQHDGLSLQLTKLQRFKKSYNKYRDNLREEKEALQPIEYIYNHFSDKTSGEYFQFLNNLSCELSRIKSAIRGRRPFEYDIDHQIEELRQSIGEINTKLSQTAHVAYSDNQSNINTAVIEELMVDDNAVEEDDPEKQPLFSDSFFVGRFIEETITTETIQKEYLQKICEGLMLCVGAYQLPSTNVDPVSLRINGTDFFFDTRLLLRLVGCAGEAAVEAVNELVNLIQGSGGNIYYYPQTWEEMNQAFDDAIHSLSSGDPPHDEEMRLYAARVKNSTVVISAKKASLQNELSNASIYLRQQEYFSETDRIRFGFDYNDLQHYMKKQLPWDQKTIENDAMSIWETHMRRQGNYTEYCGTSARLPVFVTSNSRLIGIALKFRDERQNVYTILSHWKSNRLPVITDIRLTCRLWSPAVQSERLSLLYLTSNAVAAQRPTRRYVNTIRELALELERTVPEYSGIPLPAFFDDNVTEVVLENTQGLEENLNAGNFASSIAELSEWKAREQEEITNKVKQERDQTAERLDEQTAAIIEGAVDNNKDKLGWRGILLKLILNWTIVVTILFVGITALISYLIGNWSPIWLVAVPVSLSIIEHFISSHFFVKLLLKHTLPKIERSFEKKIMRKLRKAENNYADEIVRLTKKQIKVLEKAKSMLHG